MAVEITGTPAVFSSGSTSAQQSYTIESDATAVIVIGNGVWSDSSSHDFDILNWDAHATNVDFTQIAIAADAGNTGDIFAYIMTDTSGDWPGTGSQTLDWGINNPATDGQTYVIMSVKGLDTTTPIRDTDTSINTTQTWTASLSGVLSGDLTVIARCEYNPGVDSFTHGSGQVELHDTLTNNEVSTVSTEAGEASPAVTANADSNFDAGIAFALAEAADDIDHVAALAESFDNVVQRRRIKITNF